MKDKFAKLIIMALTNELHINDEVVDMLENNIGKIDFMGKWYPFIHTKYYEPEMGSELKRSIISFKDLISADKIIDLKLQTINIEDKFRVDNKRRVNIDPGYVDLHKVALASCKGGGHMIMLGSGVYVDLLLWYNKGWQPLPWAYPDFNAGIYFEDLTKIRNSLKLQI